MPEIPSNIKNKKIVFEEYYQPPEKIRDFIYDVYYKLIRWRALKEGSYKQFNGNNLLDYLSEARQKFWGFIPLDFDSETPVFFFPETRNQIVSLLAKIANLRLKPVFDGVEGFDIVKATILQDLFTRWERSSNRKLDSFWQYLYNVLNGTVITYVGYKTDVRKVKNITKYDPKTGETEYEEEELDESDVQEVIVNLEDFYFPKLWEPSIQKQEEVIWRTLVKFSDFKEAFKGYKDVELVIPGAQFADPSIFADFLAYDVRGGDFVEVIKYFNKPKDQYAIIANGVLLNPLGKGDNQEVAPLPWNHKSLPFGKTVFEPIDSNFFFGIPLAMKVKSPQDAVNLLWSLLLDRETRAIARPIITNDPSIENGLEYKSGRFYQVQGDPNSNYRELQMDSASPSFWNALTTLQGTIQTSATSTTMPPVAGRQPRAATELAMQNEEQKQSLGLYTMFYQDLMEQNIWLALKNMIQFYTVQDTEDALGKKKFLKILSLINIDLKGGGSGNRELRITKNPAKSGDLLLESMKRSLFNKERVEIIEATPESLRKLKFDLKIKFDQELSPQNERMLFLEYIKQVLAISGQSGIVSPKKVIFRLAEKFNESVSDIVDDKVLSDYELDRFGFTDIKQQQPQGQPGQPQQPGQPAPPTQAGAAVLSQMQGQRTGAAGAGARMVNAGQAKQNPFGK
ncbi:MAG: hypothetical protein KGJ90_06555 [Patescibacteria group bacterium]|nr:hypothetical protein [Patescibacteria group bacterium]